MLPERLGVRGRQKRAIRPAYADADHLLAAGEPASAPTKLNHNYASRHQNLNPRGGELNCMARKVSYWVSTGLVAAMALLSAYSYLSGSQQAVEGFAHVGYPQQLRVLLGIAKLLGALTLVVPGWPKLKEWAYAGFTFSWIAASVAHYLANDGPKAFMPLVLLILLIVSYVTRPASRQWPTVDAAT